MLSYRFAQINVVATLFLLFVGATVHPTGSSLECPDWWFFPTCNGEVFPEMKGGVLFEHGHRLTGTVVGILILAHTILLWFRRRQDPGNFKLGLVASVLVAIQGTLGGITVHLKLPPVVSILHLATAMGLFSLLIYLADRLRPPRPQPKSPTEVPRSLRRWVGIAVCAVFAQIVLGAVVRHLGAALQCVDIPLCGGKVWPEGGLAQVHMLHRFGAVLAGGVVLGVAIATLWRARGMPRVLAGAILLVLAAQVTLGIYSVVTFLSVPVVVAHLVVGAILLGLMLSLYLALGRRSAAPRAAEAAKPWPSTEAAAPT
jgi:cytochrome c oxidase assembly protein subunit 15